MRRETGRRLRPRAGLPVVTKARQRRPRGTSTSVPTRALYPHHVWRYDVVQDETTEGRRRPCLTVREESPRAGLPMDWARSITAGGVVHVLQRLCAQRGIPQEGQSDNGPEWMAPQGTAWLPAHDVDPHVIDPGSPWQNGQNERWNGVCRAGGLHRWLCAAGQEARRIIHHWREEYNDARPHGALAGLAPKACAAQYRCQAQQAAGVCRTFKLAALSGA